MKSLSKDKVLRWVSGQQSQGGSGGGGVSVDLAGYATQIWTEQNYVNKEFFSSLFKAYDANGNEVLPNDTETVIDNIKAMFGFWTDLYISALGKSPTGQPASLFLSSMGDVSIPSPANGQVLTYDSASGKWVALTPASGVDMAQVWAAMAAVDASKQIDISHLSNALSNFLNVKEGGTVEKPVTFQDTVDIGSTLAVTGAVTMGSTLAVTGDITMGSKLVATQEWANNTFVMKSWFDQIFKVFNDQTKIAVNGDLPQDKSKMNIQAMFGFWTELYVSALGKSPDGQASLFLSSLGDVSIPSPANGQVLTYDSASGKWVALTPASGTDMDAVWSALAASDSSHQIDYSHLSGAISISNGTITIGSQSITPVSGNFLPLAGGTLTGTLTGTKFHSNANSSIDLTHIPSDSEIALETGDGGGWVSAWIWREQYSSSNWGIFHDNSYDVIHFVGNSTSRFSINLGTGDVKVGTNDVIHSGNIASQTVNKANFLNADYTQGASPWVWNPLNLTQYYVWGQQFANSYLSGDTGDMRLYLASISEAGGLGICMNIDGYVSSVSGFYTDGGYKKGGSSDSYVLLGGGGHAAISDLSVNYANSAGRLSSDSSYTAWGQSFWSYGTPNSISGNMSGVGDIQCTAGSRIHGNGGALYIGNANNAGWVQIANMCSQSGSSYWNIHANGSASFQSVYSTGAVSSLSDIRYKDIVRHFALNIEAIANASIIQFRWKESHDTETHIGGIAQEWQAILPDAVHETKDGKLAMDYGTIAYTSAVSLARKVVEQQKEIDDLKERLARLEALLTK